MSSPPPRITSVKITKDIERMTMPVYSPPVLVSVPRPDRFYRQLRALRQPSNLDHGQLMSVISEYDLFLIGSIRVHGSAGRNQSWILETTEGKKILKDYQAAEDPAQIIHEHSILQYLAQVGFPAPRLVAASDGRTTVEKAGKTYALFNFYEGYFQFHNYVFFPSQSHQFLTIAGKALGSLHATLKDFSPAGFNPSGFQSHQGPRWRELDWYGERLEFCRSTARRTGELHPEISTLLNRSSWVTDKLQALDQTLRAESPTRLIIHGDFGPYNLFFKQGSPVIILDFELARLDWRLLDFVLAFTTFAKNRLGFNLHKMAWMIQAYQSVFPIPAEELRLLPLVWQFIGLRRAIVYWYRYSTGKSANGLHAAIHWLDMVDWAAEHQASLADFSKLTPEKN